MRILQKFTRIAECTLAAKPMPLEICQAHAKPITAVLNAIKYNLHYSADEPVFDFNENTFPQSLYEGKMVIRAGLYEREGGSVVRDSGGKSGPFKAIDLIINVDGAAFYRRLDHAIQKNGSLALELKEVSCGNVMDLLPALAAWVQDNMPKKIQSMLPGYSVVPEAGKEFLYNPWVIA